MVSRDLADLFGHKIDDVARYRIKYSEQVLADATVSPRTLREKCFGAILTYLERGITGFQSRGMLCAGYGMLILCSWESSLNSLLMTFSH